MAIDNSRENNITVKWHHNSNENLHNTTLLSTNYHDSSRKGSIAIATWVTATPL